MNRTEIKVRYAETDKMGVVYHANYLIWLEVGRTEHLDKYGLNYRELEGRGIMVPVLDISCKYKSPARYDDKVIIESRITELKRLRCKFEYRVLNKKDNKLLVEASTDHTFVDSNFKPVNLKRDYLDIWEKLQLAFQEDK